MTLKNHQSHGISVCQRHPSATPSPGGFCAPCLRERLESIDPSTLQEIPNYSAPRPQNLRRCSSYSAARHQGAAVQPSRMSCDARCRDSLSDLFDQNDGKSGLPLSGLREEGEIEIQEARDRVREDIAVDRGFDEIEGEAELKTMKEFIDLECSSKKQQKKKDIRALWEAASTFSHKLKKLRRKDKIKSRGGSIGNVVEAVVDVNVNARKVRETQSEVGEYGGGLGRRSCDTDPRLSLDAAGRFSVDDIRCCFDEPPRVSWDGYLIGGTGRNYHQHQRLNPMVSFLEDVKVIDSILRTRAMVEEKLNVVVDEERTPGGSVQTRDYYKGPPGTQRRRSFERSNSQKKGAAALLEVDELKSMLNAKVSPATSELFYGAKLLTAEGRLMDSNTKDAKDECLDSVESDPKVAGSVGGADLKGIKKLQRWGKPFWGIKQRRGKSKCLDSERFDAGGLKDQELPEAWQRLKCASNEGLAHSYSNAWKVAGSIHGSGSVEAKGNGTRLKEDCVVQRNQNIRYSPSNLDNGLLRFYLTPLRSNRSKSGKSRLNTVSKGVLRGA